MKRIIGLISAAALLFAAASCQQEQLPAGNESGDVVTATFNVTIPDAMGTKAFGDASGINSFYYEVWEKNLETGAYDKRLLADIKEFDKTDAEDNKSTELSLKLVRFKTYRVFFWAQGENAKHTWTTDEGLQKVAIDYTPNIENDAFAGSTGDIDASYDFEIEDVTLVRPFAQINFATDDLGKDKGVTAGDLTLKSATVKVPGLATVYDAVNGCGITPENQTFESTDLINETFTVGEAEYDGYVLMFYALIDGEATSTVADLEATFVATRNSEDVIVNWTGKSAMNNVAIQPNYRTNFYGSLFTANGSLNVSLDQEFANINDVDLDEAELNEIFADPTVTSYTLKSDVVIEEPLVFAVADRNFTLNLDGHTISNSKGIYNESQNQWSLISVQAGNVTIEGAGTVAALEDDCFAIDVRNGAGLTIKDGTYVGNLSAVYVNSGSATIDGGTFSILQLNTGFDNVYCATLNCEDNAYNNGKAAITVNGGSFLGFEPGKSGLNGGKMSPEAKLGTNAPAVVYNEETNYYTVGEEETPAEPVEPSVSSIAEVIAAELDSEVSTAGLVIAKATSSFLIQDETGIILVYGSTSASKVSVGDQINVSGKKAVYSNMPQISDPTIDEVVSSNNAVTYPTVTVCDGAAMDNLVSTTEIKYIQYTGKLNISGNYYNVAVDGASTAIGSLVYPVSELGAADLKNKNVTVTGYYVYTSGGKYINTIVTNLAEASSSSEDNTEGEGEGEGNTGSNDTYTIIDKTEDLVAGTYYMAGYLSNYSYKSNGEEITYDWANYPYHVCTGTGTDLSTIRYSITNGSLIVDPEETSETSPVEIILEAVNNKAATFYVKFADGYLYSSAYNNRKLAVSETPVEWVATDNANGGITLKTTMTEGTISLGTAGAASKLIRSYKNEDTLKYGLVFLKKN
ncbi:MAG: hypothetical protein IJX11_04295 [Bacteroidales bacterium]|nr:hypothetical protein [Bacteroidales bacterium]